jgi:hypothetical protein
MNPKDLAGVRDSRLSLPGEKGGDALAIERAEFAGLSIRVLIRRSTVVDNRNSS